MFYKKNLIFLIKIQYKIDFNIEIILILLQIL